MKSQQQHSPRFWIIFTLAVAMVSGLGFFYLLSQPARGSSPEVHNSLKDVAEFFGGTGFYVLIVIYLRSLLKIVLGKGSLLHRFIPDDNYDHSVSIAKKVLGFLNRTHRYVGAASIIIIATHALMMGIRMWNPFLIMVLILLAWQGLFGFFLILKFTPARLKRYGYLVHAQLFSGVMIAIFAGFGHLLVQ
ncbi:hypothetical protein [uncultured Desulfobacter sp.]|uniref:hypothetical protein n=1 Tax=uncultured Desulfobacter sp. TaxID=240139 RepID=UPI0029F59E3D|nr:hypothetical protein [uncultured Desulfobacter sp.]